MTVWAFPRSDLQTSPTFAPARLGLDRGTQARAAGADDEDVDGMRLDLVDCLRARAIRCAPRPGGDRAGR